MNNSQAAIKLNILQSQMLRYTTNEGRSVRIMTETIEDWAKRLRDIELELRGLKQVEDNSY